MNNITNWLNEISKEEFRDFVYIRGINDGCAECPAKKFCDENYIEDEIVCEELFYLWAIKKGGKQ